MEAIPKQPPDMYKNPLNNGISTTISTGKRKISKPSTTFFVYIPTKKNLKGDFWGFEKGFNQTLLI